jgi:hypothetical protein
MSSDRDTYLRLVDDCRALAERSVNDSFKARWLAIAVDYMHLASRAEPADAGVDGAALNPLPVTSASDLISLPGSQTIQAPPVE